MRALGQRSQFFIVLATLTVVVAGSLVYSGGLTFGQATDAGSQTDEDVGSFFPNANLPNAPTSGQPVIVPAAAAPPQAPLDSGAGGNVNGLPSTGSGGFLDQSGSQSLAYTLVAGLAMAILGSGSLVWAYKQRR